MIDKVEADGVKVELDQPWPPQTSSPWVTIGCPNGRRITFVLEGGTRWPMWLWALLPGLARHAARSVDGPRHERTMWLLVANMRGYLNEVRMRSEDTTKRLLKNLRRLIPLANGYDDAD